MFRNVFPKTDTGNDATPSFTDTKDLSGFQDLDGLQPADEGISDPPTVVVKRNRGGQRSVLEEMRKDKNRFFEEFLKIQRERVKLEKRKVEEMKRKNDLRAKRLGLLIDVTNTNE